MFGLLGVAGGRACVVVTPLQVRACAVIHGPIHRRQLQNFNFYLRLPLPIYPGEQTSLLHIQYTTEDSLGPYACA